MSFPVTAADVAEPLMQEQFVTVHALESGTLTLPAAQFLEPCEANLRLTKPSLSFLVQHTRPDGKQTRIIFDLGIRRIPNEYSAEIQAHMLTREPLGTSPDVCASLERGGLAPADIDVVILSHVHWDHIGRPQDFQQSVFVVGHGTLELLKPSTTNGSGRLSHSHFEADLLPVGRTIELSSSGQDSPAAVLGNSNAGLIPTRLAQARWEPLFHFPAAIDVFGDRSLFIIDAPGHLRGHINLLAKTGAGRWKYLAGDACHDRRLLTGELNIAQWSNEHGATCCIHSDKAMAEQTLAMIREFELQDRYEVEVLLAHDHEWSEDVKNRKRFWPGHV